MPNWTPPVSVWNRLSIEAGLRAPPPEEEVSVVVSAPPPRDQTPPYHMFGVGFSGDPRNAAALWKNDVLSAVINAETWLAGEAITPSLTCCAIPLFPSVGT